MTSEEKKEEPPITTTTTNEKKEEQPITTPPTTNEKKEEKPLTPLQVWENEMKSIFQYAEGAAQMLSLVIRFTNHISETHEVDHPIMPVIKDTTDEERKAADLMINWLFKIYDHYKHFTKEELEKWSVTPHKEQMEIYKRHREKQQAILEENKKKYEELQLKKKQEQSVKDVKDNK